MNDENEIISLCAKNDPRAQSILYETFKGRLMGVCARYSSDLTGAEDIFHEAFYAILKHIAKAREYENIFGWMRRITINKAINHYKKNKKHMDLFSADEMDSQNVADANYKLIESKIDTQHLLELINQLPDGYRIVFNMYVIDGYPHKEIATHLGISENTSKSQLFKAKSMLKSRLIHLNKIRYEKK